MCYWGLGTGNCLRRAVEIGFGGIGFKENETKGMVRSGKTGRWGANLLGRALMRVRGRMTEVESAQLEAEG